MSAPRVVHDFPNAAELLASVEGPLLAREAENNLVLGILGAIAAGEIVPGPEALFVGVEAAEQDAPVAAVRAGSDRIALSRADAASIDALATQLRKAGVMLSGVSADNPTAIAFAERWSALTGLRSSVAMRQRIFGTSAIVQPASPPTGLARLATFEDVPHVADWIVAFDREASVAGRAPLASQAMAADKVARGKVWVWEDGRIVSMAARARRTRNGECINLVYTPPESRKKGYASALVASLAQTMLGEGHRFVCLFTDLSNPISNAIYPRVGFEPVSDAMVITFVTGAS